MTEREYFSIKYVIPGYTLILLFIGINHIPLIEILKTIGLETTFGAFLGFLSLFSGSALGFLFSQFWWWCYHSKGGLFGIPKFEEVLKELREDFDLKEPNNTEYEQKVVAVYDYVAHLVKKDEERLFEYEERRWDMYHLLSSTKWSLVIGFVVGICSRLFSQLFLSQPFSEIPAQNLILEVAVLLFIFFVVVLLVLALHEEVQQIAFEYCAVAKARVIARASDQKEKESIKATIKEVFPGIVEK